MEKALMLDVGLAKELKSAFRRNGWKRNSEIKTLCEGDFLKEVLSVLEGEAEIVYQEKNLRKRTISEEFQENNLMIDVGQAEELKFGFRRNGWTTAQIKILIRGNILRKILDVIKKRAVIQYPEYTIDGNANPFIPNGFRVKEHQRCGLFTYSKKNIDLYRTEKQKEYFSTKGPDLKKEIAQKPVLNANILFYVLKRRECIFKEWKGLTICFWGTIYEYIETGELYVPTLFEEKGFWQWNLVLINKAEFTYKDPAISKKTSELLAA